MFKFYNKHKKILSVFLCLLLVFTIVGTSYVESHAFVPLLVYGAVIGAAALVTLAYTNAMGYMPSNTSDYVPYATSVYNDLPLDGKAVIDSMAEVYVNGGFVDDLILKPSAAAWAWVQQAVANRSNNDTYSAPGSPNIHYDGVFPTSGNMWIVGVATGLQSVMHHYIFTYGNVTRTIDCYGINLLSYAGVNSLSIQYFRQDGSTASSSWALGTVYNGDYPFGTMEDRIYTSSGSPISSTSIPFDTSLEHKTIIPPFPLNMPTVDSSGTTSIPIGETNIINQTIPLDVVDSMVADVPISLTDALTIPATVVPDATTGNVDLDMVKLPLTLKDKFPFCIPFDFMEGIGLLRGNPIAPVFDFPFVIQSLGINEHFVIDLKMFDTLASVSRWFLSLLFTIMLIVATRRFIL